MATDRTVTMATIPDAYRDLFKKPTIARASTRRPDGMPHVTPIWIDFDDAKDRILINTGRKRQKHVNVEHDPQVGVSMTDPDDDYRTFSGSGVVDEITDEGAAEHMNELTQRYWGKEQYPGDREIRIIMELRPEWVYTR